MDMEKKLVNELNETPEAPKTALTEKESEVMADESTLEKMEYATINFAFPMSRYESEEILKHPKGKVMKSFMEYMKKVVVSAAKKYSEVPEGEIVTDCKVPIK